MGLISEGVDLLKLANKVQNADLYKQLGEWIDKVTELQKQNDELKTECNQLREQIRFKSILERNDGHTFIQGDDEEICPSCAAVSMRAVHLEPMHNPKPPYQKATCPACKTAYLHSVPVKRANSSP
jgi:hypothetical protein